MWTSKSLMPYTSLILCQPWQPPSKLLGVSDHDISSKYESDIPTRHVYIVNLNVLTIGFNTLFTELQRLGEVNNISPFVLSNMSIISYCKIKDAQEAIKFINEKYSSAFKAHYAKSCLQKQRLDDRFLVCVTQKEGKQSDFMELISSIGLIYSISETSLSPYKKIMMIEYDDSRISNDLYSKLNNQTIDGTKYQVYPSEKNHSFCSCNNKQILNDYKVIQKPYPIAAKKQPEKAPETNFSYFSVDPFSSSTTVSSSSGPHTPDLIVSPTIEDTITMKKKNNKSKNKSKESCSNEIDFKKISNGKDKRTTFMIRNIPNKYTQKMLIDSINKTHESTYDFVYLRMDFKNKCNVGYAFINFIDPKSVVSFAEKRNGKSWEHFKSSKKCLLSYATIRGKDALVRKFKNSPVMEEDDSYKPKLFYSSGPNKGKEQPFVKTPPRQNRSRNSKHRKH